MKKNSILSTNCPFCGKSLILQAGSRWIEVDIDTWNNNTKDRPAAMLVDNNGNIVPNCNMCGKPNPVTIKRKEA